MYLEIPHDNNVIELNGPILFPQFVINLIRKYQYAVHPIDIDKDKSSYHMLDMICQFANTGRNYDIYHELFDADIIMYDIKERHWIVIPTLPNTRFIKKGTVFTWPLLMDSWQGSELDYYIAKVTFLSGASASIVKLGSNERFNAFDYKGPIL